MDRKEKTRYTEGIVRKRKNYYFNFFSRFKLAWWIIKNIKMENTEKIFIYPGKIVVWEVFESGK